MLETTGRYAEAEPLYHKALAIEKAALPESHPAIANSLNNLALLLHSTGRYDDAEPLHREALAIRKAALPVGHPAIATSLNNLAGLLDITGRYGEAEPLYREALAIDESAYGREHPDVAVNLINLAALLDTTGRHNEAEPLYRQALLIAQGGGEPELLWSVQGNLSGFYADQGHRPLAIFFGKQAVNTLQSVRQNLARAKQATQQAFLKTKESYYKDLADLLIAEARLPEATRVLDMLKEQEFHDFIRRDAASDPRRTRAGYNPFEAEQLEIYEAGSGDLARIGAEYRKLTELDAFDLTPEQEARMQALEAELKVAYQSFQQALTGIKTAFSQLGDARREELARRQLLQGKDDRGLVRDLGEGVALLHTLVLEDKVHLLLTLPEVLLARRASVGEGAINTQVQRLRQALQDPRQDPRPAARALYRHLIDPVSADLDAAGIKTLMVSLDGALRYIPLAALHDGERYLVERYALTVFTEVARENLKQRPSADWMGIGLGVSLAHEGVGPTRHSFSALPTVPAELEGIIRREWDEDPDGVLPGRYFLDARFTEPTLRKALRYPVLHIASHFSLRPGNESMSFLLLGDGSTLQLRQIREDNYDFGNVELLTLSACETAVGGRNAKGREVEGLGTLAQLQGAKGVIATLWPVADASTGQFMQTLYRLRQEQGLTKAEALRRAQLSLLNGSDPERPCGPSRGPVSFSGEGGETEQTPLDHPCRYSHPYYWAPFILMGNWL